MSKAQSKSKKVVESEEESSEEEVVTKKQVKTTKGAAAPVKKAAPAKKVVESDEESSEEEVIKPAPKGKTVQKADAKAAAKKKVESDSEESELEDVKPKGKAAAAPVKKAAPAKKVVESDEESSEEEVKPKGKAAAAPAKKAAAKKVEESEESDDEDSTPKVQPKKAAVQAKKPAAKEESEEEEEEEEEAKPVKTQAAKPAAVEDDGNYEVFIKGLPFQASENDIKEYFAEAGEVVQVNLLKGPDGRSKGIAFVKYTNSENVATAISYSGGDFGGRQILVEKTTPKGQRNDGAQGGRGGFGAKGGAGGPAEYGPKSERDPSSCSIFVGNLSWGTDEGSLQNFFAACGKVANVRIARDPEGNARGFGHVDFASPDAVEKAVAKAGQNLDGRPIRVDYATSKKQDGGNRGGFGGGGRGGFGGGRGGFGGGAGGQRMNLGEEDAAKKKGAISSFQGTKQRL